MGCVAERIEDSQGKGVENVGTHIITDDCTNCGACDGACPVDAVSAKGNVRVINQETCIDCGACDDVCPLGAIRPE